MNEAETKRCPHCLHELDQVAAFCPFCGKEPVLPPPPKEISIIWPLLLLFVVPLVACGGCFLGNSTNATTTALYIEVVSIVGGIILVIIRQVGPKIP